MTGQIKVHFVLLHTGYIQLRQVILILILILILLIKICRYDMSKLEMVRHVTPNFTIMYLFLCTS